MALLFGAIVGLALGLTGGGGSIFAVPLLIYGLDVAPKDATTISLAAVCLTAAVGAGDGARARLLETRPALIFAAAGIVFAPLGVWLGEFVASGVIVTGFALLMLAVALRMWLQARAHPEEAVVVRAGLVESPDDPHTMCRYDSEGVLRLTAPCSAALVVLGALIGTLSGFFGVGGGFLIVPTLMLVTRMGIHRAVATSLFVIALIGISGVLTGWWLGRELPWTLTGLFVFGGVAGMGFGRMAAARLAGPTLQRMFAGAMAGIGSFMLISEFLIGI